jgi:Protein of unknown function (DUF4031)
VSVYVDNAFGVGDWGRWSGGGHLQADTVEELHEFADQLGLRREWFQSKAGRPENDHYDLGRIERQRALKLGAIAEDRAAGTRRRQAIRRARLSGPRCPRRRCGPADRPAEVAPADRPAEVRAG